MPVRECKKDGKPGYKWGDSGKCYTYTSGNEKSRKNAKAKAHKQGAAIKSKSDERIDKKAISVMAEKLIGDNYIPMAFSSHGLRLIDIKAGMTKMSEMKVETKDKQKYDVVDAVVAVGDKFYGNIFVPSGVLKATAHLWNGTYNDLSHFGTMYPSAVGFTENLDYITGYNTDAFFDDVKNAVCVKMHINHDAPKYKTWKNLVDVSMAANRMPNVSIFGFSKFKYIKATEIPSGVKIPKTAVMDDKVITMFKIVPFAITTCLQGKCNDEEGCGITSKFINEYDSHFHIYDYDNTTCNVKLDADDDRSSPDEDLSDDEEQEDDDSEGEKIKEINKEILKELIKEEKIKEREKK